MDKNECEYDVNKFLKLVSCSTSYEELKIACDLHGIKCIMTQDEYEHAHEFYKSYNFAGNAF